MGTVNVVLYQPEIPQNSGNIMRTCAASNAILHFIKPLGFSLDEKSVRRSAANYVKYTKFFVYESWEEFITKNINESSQLYFLTRYGKKSVYDVNTKDSNNDYFLVFGRESTGIPKDILKEHLDRCIRLPMTNHIRSLNLSNVVAIMVFEAFRQQGFPNMSQFEPDDNEAGFKGKDFLEK